MPRDTLQGAISAGRWPMKQIGALALVMCGCAITTSSSDPPELAQERCPFEGAPLEAAKTDCSPEVLAPFVQSVSDASHRNWDPQTTLANPNGYVSKYGGKALTAVLGVSVDAQGKVAAVDLARSSGDDTLDSLALNALPKGRSVLYPPACALRDGAFQFRLGMCLEVINPRRWKGPRIHIDWPTTTEASR
jgi:TonB family protein